MEIEDAEARRLFRKELADTGQERVLVNLLSGVYGSARGPAAHIAREFLEEGRVAAEQQHRQDALAVAKEANLVAFAAFVLAAVALAVSLGVFG